MTTSHCFMGSHGVRDVDESSLPMRWRGRRACRESMLVVDAIVELAS